MSSTPFKLQYTDAGIQSAAAIDDAAQVDEQLRRLSADLTADIFRDAIQAGLAARNATTDASAPTAAGGQQWFSVVESLRTMLMGLANPWHKQDVRNCPQIVSPDARCAFVVMTGDPLTGTTGAGAPTNQTDKGDVTRAYIETNRQIELLTKEAREKGTQVWVLLYHYDKTRQEVRFELSLPIGFEARKITAWETRLILGRISSVPEDPIVSVTDEPETAVTVDVTPKSGTR